MRRHRMIAITVVALALAGCGSAQNSAERAALAALSLNAPQQASTTCRSVGPAPAGPLTASLRPPSTLPGSGAMPAGSYMARIRRRGYLIAGVNAGLLGFGYLNPFTGNIEGFEIDLARQVAKAIFGNPNDIQLKALTVDERIPSVQDGDVDLVVDAVTITPARRQCVDFSTVYYEAHQRVLVPSTSKAHGLEDLGGKRVCASAQSAPIPVIQNYPSHPIAVGAPQAIDCLVYLQQGRVDAISTDDSILEGFKAQDPYTKLVGPSLADVPYGIAISKSHPDLVRFVNGVLAQLETDGGWRQSVAHWLGGLGPVPAPPRPVYSG
jgi:polar amino acid transport system substrate-binding protein